MQPAWVTGLHWHDSPGSPPELQAAISLIAKTSSSPQVVVQDLATGTKVRELAVCGASSPIRLSSWAPHARFLLIALQSGGSWLYNVCTGHEHKIASSLTRPIVWAPDGSMFAAKAHPGGTIVVFQAGEVPTVLWEVHVQGNEILTPLAWCGVDSATLLVNKQLRGESSGYMIMCSCPDGVFTSKAFSRVPHMMDVQISHDGNVCAMLVRDAGKCGLQLWRLPSRELVSRCVLNALHTSNMAFSGSDHWLAVAHARVGASFQLSIQSTREKAALRTVRVSPQIDGGGLPVPFRAAWTADEKCVMCSVKDFDAWHHAVLVRFG